MCPKGNIKLPATWRSLAVGANLLSSFVLKSTQTPYFPCMWMTATPIAPTLSRALGPCHQPQRCCHVRTSILFCPSRSAFAVASGRSSAAQAARDVRLFGFDVRSDNVFGESTTRTHRTHTPLLWIALARVNLTLPFAQDGVAPKRQHQAPVYRHSFSLYPPHTCTITTLQTHRNAPLS